MRLIRDPYFLAISLNHLGMDFINSQKAILLVFLAPGIGMSNADIGLVTLIYTACAALTQPLFGLLADRYRAYWLSGFGLLWIAVWFGVAVLSPGWWAIPALILGALGSAALHASGTERAASRGKKLMVGGAATATSVFFLFGQAGFSLGPFIGGLVLQAMGALGILFLVAGMLPIAMNALYWMHVRPARLGLNSVSSEDEGMSMDAPRIGLRKGWWVLAAFALLIALRTTPTNSTITFLPKLFEDRGSSPAVFGAVVSVFMAGYAVGGVGGGILADGWGARRTLLSTLLAAVVPTYLYPVTLGPAVYPLVFLAGIFNGASHSVIVVLSQALLPGSGALASGLTLGFMFSSGSVGSYLLGIGADLFSLTSVLQLNGVLLLVAALLSLTLWMPIRQQLEHSPIPRASTGL